MNAYPLPRAQARVAIGLAALTTSTALLGAVLLLFGVGPLAQQMMARDDGGHEGAAAIVSAAPAALDCAARVDAGSPAC